jgi:DNA-binding LacI/PurR family transcriptional regulator
MKLNHNESAKKLVMQCAVKNGVTMDELANRLGWSKGSVSKVLHHNRNLRPETLTAIIQAINPNYEVNIRFLAKDRYRVTVVVKNSTGIVDGYNVEIKNELE